MKAVGYYENLPSSDPKSLVDLDLPKPSPTGRDILVEVKAISVNPVDTKIRQGRAASNGQPEVLGWDATGIVAAIGPEVTGYAPGDKVWYAGDISRPGTNSEFHLVDERIVGRMPETLGFSAAAALPLTTLTAYEMLFDRLKVTEPVAGGAKAVLIIGGSGGVGSIAIQLLRALSDVTVIATASRPETQAWVTELGAHHVIDHSQPLAEQVAALDIGAPSFVFSTTHSDSYISEVTSLIAPQGRYGLIDDPAAFDIMPFKGKSISIHWELMYTRSLFQTADITRQQDILNEVAALVDAGKVRTTTDEPLGLITAENLRKAHGMLESNKTKGKLVLEGFPG
ncbi:zinc-binding alcohol dehydrogenase family protein [Tropicibacter sp. R15_0]|uniref:zinc-binding alcohol dehydrogenase family protein n=1 Tax=Tropicibacter sp. R15_0 TaxID=2821101 RepID=UPI001ADAE165|nr:zinc-binding alcohol dehydrogenase family protein [Tropicibacter sp. R15_0]MBO9468026.1 zinc-binding alcohol dehydrogenase family protein [Tropicibacter sp. R15_0]